MLDRARVKATTRGLSNIEFRLADMTSLGYPNDRFDVVVSVFSIFFVPDMEGLTRELWRMVRPGGKLAITTWGPRIFEPAYSRWQAAIKRERPDLYSAFNPWDRITDVESVRRLLQSGGAANIDVEAEDGFQALRTAEDWWIIALGSGLRWVIDQMAPQTAARMKADNVGLAEGEQSRSPRNQRDLCRRAQGTLTVTQLVMSRLVGRLPRTQLALLVRLALVYRSSSRSTERA